MGLLVGVPALDPVVVIPDWFLPGGREESIQTLPQSHLNTLKSRMGRVSHTEVWRTTTQSLFEAACLGLHTRPFTVRE